MAAIDKELNMNSSSAAVRIQDLPFNKSVQPLVIKDRLVQKFQKTLKQSFPGTEIDVFKQVPNDWRCQNMWNGCKKLRSSTQCDACTAYALSGPIHDDQIQGASILRLNPRSCSVGEPLLWHYPAFQHASLGSVRGPALFK